MREKMFRWYMRSCIVTLCLASLVVNIPVIEVASGQRDEKRFRYVALGDSIARGYGLKEPKNDSYPGIIAGWLKERYDYVFYDNLGIDGLESKELLEILCDKKNEHYQKFTKTLQNVDLVTLSIGGNDLMHRLNLNGGVNEMLQGNRAECQKACEDLIVTFPQIVNRIRELAPHSQIVVNTLYNPCVGLSWYESVYDVADNYIKKLNVAYYGARNISVVDIHKAFAKSKEKLVNMALRMNEIDPHPNQKGHELIARNTIAVLR